ncbi:unnamed protein product [Strongylus vulgaris]|uniref:Uncharacterized protein n=1 Tax=Strongylus vulgaris TaxID=40348 RepID=A0A3P7JYA8_STRVU|nr:unnamed protein product [Strongylus vulgaris]
MQASDLNVSNNRHGGKEFEMPPTAVVGPRQCIRSTRVTTDMRGSNRHLRENDMEQYRHSLQQLNGRSNKIGLQKM